MSEQQAIYQARPKAAPAPARMALQYRQALQALREMNQTCDEIAEDRDRAIIEIEALTKKVKRLTKELARLRGEKEEA